MNHSRLYLTILLSFYKRIFHQRLSSNTKVHGILYKVTMVWLSEGRGVRVDKVMVSNLTAAESLTGLLVGTN